MGIPLVRGSLGVVVVVVVSDFWQATGEWFFFRQDPKVSIQIVNDRASIFFVILGGWF